jgi:steroid delta-isomerase-like uncharacterized protein
MNNKDILLEFIERVWNEKKIESVSEFLDTEYSIHIDTGDPWEGKTLSHNEYKKRLQYSFSSFPDIHFSIQTAISDGDFVAITWILTGTNLGYIDKYPPTNKNIHTMGMTIYQFRNGRICAHSQVFDRTTVMKQLGYIK